MENFKVPQTKPKKNKTIRFPKDILEQVDKLIQGKNCTFTDFVIEATKSALQDLERNN